MNTEPKFVLLGRGHDPSGHIGHTHAEWDRLFDAMAIADPLARGAAVSQVVGAASAPKPRGLRGLDVAAIYAKRNAR
ncbi:hypothetical protein GRZ55_14135 [Chelativorans sp. ZYF759]|uniref:hypothetical protein n=1 Tax=Chelativorans sp. ZYF759 TaxID=2692213 RepID=UPI00145D5866|nr:hypothetical protein [Chelativorans sp. ZYF759]NMG40383.1 hypothetical protein [Chelativorans sp. ZYF759]